MKSILIKAKEFEKKVGIMLESGTSSVEVILTQKECPEFSSIAKVSFYIDVIKAIDDEEYAVITEMSQPNGRGIKKYENHINLYKKKLIESLAIDVDSVAEKVPRDEYTKVVIGIDKTTEKAIYINLSSIDLDEELKIVKGKMDFYTRKEIVGMYAAGKWDTLYNEYYVKINKDIYRKLSKNKISELNNEFNEKNLLRIADCGLFECVSTIEQIDTLEEIKECSLFYENNKLYQLNEDNNNLYDTYYSFYGDKFKCYEVLPDYQSLVEDLSDLEIKQFVLVEKKVSYSSNHKVLDLKLIYIDKIPYIIEQISVGSYYSGLKNYITLFYSNGYLYGIILPLSDFCFYLNSSMSSRSFYGDRKHRDRYTNISLSLAEFIEKCEEEGYITYCDDMDVFNEIIPNLAGKKASLIKELTEKSTLVNVDGVIVEQYTNRMVVTVEYFGHFKEIVNISNLLITENIKYISYWDGCNEVETRALINIITGEIIDIETTDVDNNYNNLEGEFIEYTDGKIEQVILRDDDKYFAISKTGERFKEIEIHGTKYIVSDEINKEDLCNICGVAH